MSDDALPYSRGTSDVSAVISWGAFVLPNASTVAIAAVIIGTQIEVIASIDGELAANTAWVDDCTVLHIIAFLARLKDTISAHADVSRLSSAGSASTKLRRVDDFTLHRITQVSNVTVASACGRSEDSSGTAVSLSQIALGAQSVGILDPVSNTISTSTSCGIERLAIGAGTNTLALAISVVDLIARRASAVGADAVANVGIIHSNLWWRLSTAVEVAHASTC